MIAHPVTCPVFLGREDELEALAEARRALSKSRGSVVLIGGDAGIGKSRLLAQFLGTVRRDTRPRNLASAECSDFAQIPFGPFREMLAALRESVPADDLPESARRALQRFSRTVASDLQPVEDAELFLGVECLPRPEPWAALTLTVAAAMLEEHELDPLRRLIAMPVLPNDEPGKANVTLTRAILDDRFGSHDAARTLALDAAERYGRLRRPLFEARAYELAGERAHAFEIFERCGAVTDVRRLRSPNNVPSATRALAPNPNPALAALSERELAIARAMAGGATNAAIGESLCVSVKTIEKHVTTIFAKLGVSKRTQVVAFLARHE